MCVMYPECVKLLLTLTLALFTHLLILILYIITILTITINSFWTNFNFLYHVTGSFQYAESIVYFNHHSSCFMKILVVKSKHYNALYVIHKTFL